MRNVVFIFLLILVFLVPWEPMIVFAEFGTLARWVGYCAAVLAAISVVPNLSLKRVSLAFIFLALFWFWATLSYTWTLDEEASKDIMPTYFSLLIFTWLIVEFSQSWRQQLWVLRAYLLGCVVSLTMLIGNIAAIGGGWVGSKIRFSAANLNPNHLAAVLVFSVPVAIYLATSSTGRIRWLYWFYIPAASIGVLFTGSRAGGLALALYIAAVALKLLRTSWAAKIMLIASVICIIVLITQVVPSHLVERVLSVRDIDLASKAERRLELWQHGWDVFKEYPVAGIGIGAYGVVTGGSKALSAHNVFLSVLTETGLVGLTIFLLFLGTLGYNVLKLPKAERSLWLEVLALWSVFAMTAPNEHIKPTWFVYGIILSQSVFFRSLQSQRKLIPLKRRQYGWQLHKAPGY